MYIPEELRENLYCDDKYDKITVPKRYSDAIVGHVVSNYLNNNHYYNPPLYLAIKGDPGEGKTLQAIAACNQKKILVKYLSSSKLSGEMESESREVMEKVYKDALQLRRLGFYICILIDDFHLGNASIKNSATRTVNAELLVGYMMNLAESIKTERIPILLTGNDFSGTYDALLRDGRADIFLWEPTFDEKYLVVKSVLEPLIKNDEKSKLKAFVRKYQSCNIAFFSQLRNDMRKAIIEQMLDNVSEINQLTISSINNNVHDKFCRLGISDFEKMAETRIKNRRKGGVQ